MMISSYKETSQQTNNPTMIIYNYLKDRGLRIPAITSVPPTDEYATSESDPSLSIPLYGELTIPEVEALMALDTVRTSVTNDLIGLAQAVIKEFNLSNVKFGELAEDLYECVSNRSSLIVNTGEIHPYEESSATIEIAEAAKKVGEYDPATLLGYETGSSEQWTLRMTAYRLSEELRSQGFLGSSVEKLVENVLNKSSRILNGEIRTIDILHLIPVGLYDLLSLYRKINSPEFKLELLFIMRCGAFNAPVLKRSTAEELSEKIKHEFPREEEPIAVNPENQKEEETEEKPAKVAKKH